QEEKENIEKAERLYNRCLEVNPQHPTGKAALHALCIKLGRVPEKVESPVIENPLHDLKELELELEFKKESDKQLIESALVKAFLEKHNITIEDETTLKEPSPLSSSPEMSNRNVKSKDKSKEDGNENSQRKSLSPVSQKFAMQEGVWKPPPDINTTSSFMSQPPPFRAPVCNFPPHFDPNVVPPMFLRPPPSVYPPKASTSTVSQEDDGYRARVDEFLRDIAVPRESSSTKKSNEKEKKVEKRMKKRKDSSKKAKKRRLKSRSRDRRSEKSSSSSNSSTSSDSSGSSSSSSSRSSSTHSSRSSSSSRSLKRKKRKSTSFSKRTSFEEAEKMSKKALKGHKDYLKEDSEKMLVEHGFRDTKFLN
ncbi:hypothetical protein SK128_011494, partial [Halocaridina rubra]